MTSHTGGLPVLYRPSRRALSESPPSRRPSYRLEPLEPRILFAAAAAGLVVPRPTGDSFPLIVPARDGIYYASSLSDDTGIFLARLTDNGDVDTSFGTGGSVAIGGVGPLVSAFAQPDGKVLAMTDASADGHTSILMRFDAHGRPDATFGVNGRVTVPGLTDWYGDLAVLDDGRIVVGEAVPGAAGQPGQAAFFRFTPDGQLDDSFGDGGVARIQCPSSVGYAWDLRVGPDGHVSMIAVTDDVSNSVFLVGVDTAGAPDPGVGNGTGVLMLADGQIQFGAGGLLHNLRGGKVLLVDREPDEDGGIYLERALPSGVDDPSFGEGGIATPQVGMFSALATLPVEWSDGRVLLPAFLHRSPTSADEANLGLIVITDDGTLDTSFGTGGLATVPRPADFRLYQTSAAIDPAGRVVTATLMSEIVSGQLRLMVSRFRPDGSLDAAFGGGGSMQVDADTVTAPPEVQLPQPSAGADSQPEPAPPDDVHEDPATPAAGGAPRTNVFFAGDDRRVSAGVFADFGADGPVWGSSPDDLFDQ